MQATPSRPIASSALMKDPDALRQAWLDLRARHAHTHGPEAAQMLGVPEAALQAASIGHGAVALAGNWRDLLAEAGQWGKLLVAVRNGLGVGLFIADDVQVDRVGTAVALRSSTHNLVLDVSARQAIYLLEDHDAHGRTFSINGFDGCGDVVARVFLMSKSGREKAQPFLQQWADPAQARTWQGWSEASTVLSLPEPQPVARECVGQVRGPAAADAARRLVLGLAGLAGPVVVQIDGQGAAAHVVAGSGIKTSETPGAVHASHAAFKLHLRASAAVQVDSLAQPDGPLGVCIQDGHGGTLSLLAAAGGPGVSTWLQSMTEGAAHEA